MSKSSKAPSKYSKGLSAQGHEKMAAASKRVELTFSKDCKHSAVYSTNDPDAPVTSVYLMRKGYSKMPTKIGLTIDVLA